MKREVLKPKWIDLFSKNLSILSISLSISQINANEKYNHSAELSLNHRFSPKISFYIFFEGRQIAKQNINDNSMKVEIY